MPANSATVTLDVSSGSAVLDLASNLRLYSMTLVGVSCRDLTGTYPNTLVVDVRARTPTGFHLSTANVANQAFGPTSTMHVPYPSATCALTFAPAEGPVLVNDECIQDRKFYVSVKTGAGAAVTGELHLLTFLVQYSEATRK